MKKSVLSVISDSLTSFCKCAGTLTFYFDSLDCSLWLDVNLDELPFLFWLLMSPTCLSMVTS